MMASDEKQFLTSAFEKMFNAITSGIAYQSRKIAYEDALNGDAAMIEPGKAQEIIDECNIKISDYKSEFINCAIDIASFF